MAFKAKITNVKRSDLQITIEFEITDTVSKFTQPRVETFNDGDTITFPVIQERLEQVASRFKAAIAKEETLKAKIGTEFTI